MRLSCGSPNLAPCGLVVGLAERGSRGNARDCDAFFGHFARAQGLGHRLVRDAEKVAVQVGPHPFRLVVGGDAYDGEGLPGDHARADGDVGGGDVRADDGEGLGFTHVLGETGEHDTRPGGAACPQKAPREGVAPGEVVDGARRAGEHRRHLVAVHAHTAEVEHVEHFDIQVLGAGDTIAKGRVVAQSSSACATAFAALRWPEPTEACITMTVGRVASPGCWPRAAARVRRRAALVCVGKHLLRSVFAHNPDAPSGVVGCCASSLSISTVCSIASIVNAVA